MFSKLSNIKLKIVIAIGPQIRALMKSRSFEGKLT